MIDTVFVPCGHMATCHDCGVRMKKKPCPICRVKIKIVGPSVRERASMGMLGCCLRKFPSAMSVDVFPECKRLRMHMSRYM